VLDGAVNVPELRVAIGMVVPFLGLAVALQAVAIFSQELADFGVADRVALGSQFRRQRAGALAGPAQGRLRVAARRRLVNACRPPLWWRIRPVASGAPCNSSTPLVNVTRDRPQARLTRDTPP
jgi:hypothetical protein